MKNQNIKHNKVKTYQDVTASRAAGVTYTNNMDSMNKEQYNSLPDDLKLDARLAITMGYRVKIKPNPIIAGNYLEAYKEVVIDDLNVISESIIWCPRQDPAILWELVKSLSSNDLFPSTSSGTTFFTVPFYLPSATIEEALIKAYCEADPHGHWAKWCNENEVSI
jgi:hypothetical protein